MARAYAPAGRTALLAAVALLAALSGCGKKANLDPPPGEVSQFPHVYPYAAGQVPPGQPQPQHRETQPVTPGEEPPQPLSLPQPGLPQTTSPLITEP
jgi:hypothetical protein